MPQHLSYHLTTHEKDKVEKFTCSYPGCGSSFRQKWILRDHEKTHLNIYKFHCHYDGCDKKYNTRSNLEVHLRKHEGVRPFVCDSCGKQYISKWNMAKHQKKGCEQAAKEALLCTTGRIFNILQEDADPGNDKKRNAKKAKKAVHAEGVGQDLARIEFQTDKMEEAKQSDDGRADKSSKLLGKRMQQEEAIFEMPESDVTKQTNLIAMNGLQEEIAQNAAAFRPPQPNNIYSSKTV